MINELQLPVPGRLEVHPVVAKQMLIREVLQGSWDSWHKRFGCCIGILMALDGCLIVL